MKSLSVFIQLLITVTLISCGTQKEKTQSVEFAEFKSDKKVNVLIEGKLFTSLKWPENVYKPVLQPVCASSGTVITRGFPLEPKTGERADHRHHVGNWLNYGNVNGNDFWGNGHTGERSSNGGEILFKGIEKMTPGDGEGILITNCVWVDSVGIELLKEKTEYHFIVQEEVRIIDRITTITALEKEISLADTKEGMFAIRVARELELPSDGRITIVDENGEPKSLDKASTKGITGNYTSSEGISGEEVWGTRAKWMNLTGSITDEKISILICDHPDNLNYPTYWHARGYGLFSANPLGVRDFTRGEKELNFSLSANESLTFKYRIVISSGTYFTSEESNSYAEEFSIKY